MALYMAVTADDKELPIAVTDTAKELAEILGTTPGCIYSYISRDQKGVSKRGTGDRKCPYLVKKINDEEDPGEEV